MKHHAKYYNRKAWNVTMRTNGLYCRRFTFRVYLIHLDKASFCSSAGLFRLHTKLIYKHAHRVTAVVGFTTKSEIRVKVSSIAIRQAVGFLVFKMK